MPALTQEINALAEEFERCRQILLALGDENRQHLMLEMMRMGRCDGARVGAITKCAFVRSIAASARSQKRRISPARRYHTTSRS